MNVNKKLDRLKQWAGERMGGEAKTNVSDDFKALEIEMGLRHEGMSLCLLFALRDKRVRRVRTGYHEPVLISDRHGKAPQVDDPLHQGDVEAE